MRDLLAVVAGLAVGTVVNMAIIEVHTRFLFPMEPGLDLASPVHVQAHLDALPPLAFIVIMAAHLGQAFVGGGVAARLSITQPVGAALMVGGLSLLGGVSAFFMFVGPSWMAVELPLYLVVAYCAARLETWRRAGRLAAQT